MQIVLRSNDEGLVRLTNLLDNLLESAHVSSDMYANIVVALIEAVKNAIIHGNKSNENSSIIIDYTVTPTYLEFQVSDSGEGFKQEKVPNPTAPENIEKEGGRGVYLMKKLASQCEYNEKGNAVRLRFDL
ncbi:MAG: ATP-binding protein [Bacteroidetes bacterium]|nr:ATP-binding protein [Bacteroidota bacterium]